MQVRGVRKVKKIVRQATSGFRSEVVILLYHRVTDLEPDPQLLSVSPKHFKQHLELLYSSRYTLLSLEELLKSLERGKLPRRSVVITFDDGYVDNLEYAKPLLEQYDSPATVYVATGNLGCGRGFWWDDLSRILLAPNILPAEILLEINGENLKWNMSSATSYSKEDHQRDQYWNVADPYAPTPRHELYRSLCELLRPLSYDERECVMHDLIFQTGGELPDGKEDRLMTADEVLKIAEGGLIEVGAHTNNHPMLSALSAEDQHREIYKSKCALEKILDRSLSSFSYPYGGRSHYTSETVQLVKEIGFSSACSNFPELIGIKADPFQLPRHLVRDWNADEFGQWLGRWFRG